MRISTSFQNYSVSFWVAIIAINFIYPNAGPELARWILTGTAGEKFLASPESPQSYSDFYILLQRSSMCVYGTAAVLSILKAYDNEDPDRKALHRLLIYIPTIGFLSKILSLLGSQPIFTDRHGRPFYFALPLFWLSTGPLLSYEIGYFTNNLSMGRQNCALALFIAFYGASLPFWDHPLKDLIVLATLVLIIFNITRMQIHSKVPWSVSLLDNWALEAYKNTHIIYLTITSLTHVAFGRGLISFNTRQVCLTVAELLNRALVIVLLGYSQPARKNHRAEIAKLEKSIDEDTREILAANDSLLGKLIPGPEFDSLMAGHSESKVQFQDITVVYAKISSLDATIFSTEFGKLAGVWAKCDELAKRNGVTSLPTGGISSYLAIAGMLGPDVEAALGCQASRAASFTLEMQALFKDLKETQQYKFEVGFGIAMGPATAVALQTVKPKWHLIGRSLGLVSLMEETSKGMRIHISQRTFEKIEPTKKFILRKDVLKNVLNDQAETAYWLNGSATSIDKEPGDTIAVPTPVNRELTMNPKFGLESEISMTAKILAAQALFE